MRAPGHPLISFAPATSCSKRQTGTWCRTTSLKLRRVPYIFGLLEGWQLICRSGGHGSNEGSCHNTVAESDMKTKREENETLGTHQIEVVVTVRCWQIRKRPNPRQCFVFSYRTLPPYCHVDHARRPHHWYSPSLHRRTVPDLRH